MAQDHLSTYLIATAYRAILDVSELQRRAQQAAFASGLASFIKTLSALYAASNEPNRKFRLLTAAHPSIDRTSDLKSPEHP